ncbi:hypothetical protein [Streptomyces sp. NPDC091212]|uniref:hypothetical protein n=1 Tax=Streptomyces sp. NPDC091212 TaxID=3155191 RepID=UPI0034298ADB
MAIEGEPGSGRRTSALRALGRHLYTAAGAAHIIELSPDWDDEETPDADVLPEPTPGIGYILDLSARPLPSQAAYALASWAEKLHATQACVALVTGPGLWTIDPLAVVPSQRPDPLTIARNHLAGPLGSPEHADWLSTETTHRPARTFRPGTSAPTHTGALRDIMSDRVSPTDAVAMATRIKKISPARLQRALEQQATEGVEADDIRKIKDEVRLWEGFLTRILTEPGTRGADRTMLLAASYLEGAPLELCIKIAGRFGESPENPTRRYREGRSPRRRMQSVGVDVSEDDRAVFHRMPGLAMTAIRTDWHHWAEERHATRDWLKNITTSGAVPDQWSEQIARRLLELSRTATEPPLFPILKHWIETSGADSPRLDIAARILTDAANTPELEHATHRYLLDTNRNNPAHRTTVALVCRGAYGARHPNKALTRLRWILGHNPVDDRATIIAADALITQATASNEGFTRVINAVETWLTRYEEHTAGPRAFLALADPAHSALPQLLTRAKTSFRDRDFLIEAWTTTLAHPSVRERAYTVLRAWARAVHTRSLDQDFVFALLTDVRNAHTPRDAMSRFLYGNPEAEDPALIEARHALANLQTCRHNLCARPDCNARPQTSEASATIPNPDPAGTG